MRKTAFITISAQGRDLGKVYKLTEMPASQSEWWATRLFLAMANAGIEVPDEVAESGLAGVASLGAGGIVKLILGAVGGIKQEDAKPLLDEMMACVACIPDPMQPERVRSLIEDDIEEVATRFKLRKEVVALHTDFFAPVEASTSTSNPTRPDAGVPIA